MPKPTITYAIGDRVNMLTVVDLDARKEPAPYRASLGVKSERAVRVRCDCGTEMLIRPYELRAATKSCGCWRGQSAAMRAAARNATHGLSKHPEYQTWMGMLRRCMNPKDQDWHRYGGRGITVCAQWRSTPYAFLAYCDTVLGPRPEGLTLDRIDNARGYEPGNIRWADAITQRRNQDRYRMAHH